MKTLIFTLLTSISISPVWANLFTADSAGTVYEGYGGVIIYDDECHASGGTPVTCDVGALGTTAFNPVLDYDDFLVGAIAEANSGSYSVYAHAAGSFDVDLVFDSLIPIAYFQFNCFADGFGGWADCNSPPTNITGPLSSDLTRAGPSTQYVSYAPGQALHFSGRAVAGSNDFGPLRSVALIWAYPYDKQFNFIPRSAWRAQLTPEPSELPLVTIALFIMLGRLLKPRAATGRNPFRDRPIHRSRA